MAPSKILAFALTDTGVHRAFNEDAYLVDDDLGLYLVADGMGGHAGGEVASRIAVESVREVMSKGSDTGGDLLADGVRRASEAIYRRAHEEDDLRGLGTTLTAVAFCRSHVHLAHVGDSRCYLIRDRIIRQVSEDHTVVLEMMRAGILTPEQVEKSPIRNHLSRSVGCDPEVTVDRATVPIRAGDVFVLCSDGLVLSEIEIRNVILENFLRDAPRILVDLANDRGGPDNITVVVLSVNGDDE
jgi:protein phosphatase